MLPPPSPLFSFLNGMRGSLISRIPIFISKRKKGAVILENKKNGANHCAQQKKSPISFFFPRQSFSFSHPLFPIKRLTRKKNRNRESLRAQRFPLFDSNFFPTDEEFLLVLMSRDQDTVPFFSFCCNSSQKVKKGNAKNQQPRGARNG